MSTNSERDNVDGYDLFNVTKKREPESDHHQHHKEPIVTERTSFVINVVMHCIILLSILSVFFVLIVSNVEKQAFQGQFDDISTSDTLTIMENIDSEVEGEPVKTFIGNNLDEFNFFYQTVNVQDPVKVANNSWLFFSNGIVLALFILILGVILVTIALVAKKRVPIAKMFTENCLVFLVVGAVELSFFLNIASKFSPVSASFITDRIVTRARTNILGPDAATPPVST